METATTTLQIAPLAMGLLGGLAIFLFGMELLTDALKTVAGGGMQRILARLTSNRFGAALAGAFVTAVIQSSSVTTVLVVGFVSAGLMSLSQSVGVILGANIGTTVTRRSSRSRSPSTRSYSSPSGSGPSSSPETTGSSTTVRWCWGWV